VTFAAGLAAQGILPVVCIYSTFLQRAYDNILHDVALQNLHVVFCLDRAGLVGDDGPTHHGAFDLSYLRAIPGMVVMAPKDEAELVAMLRTAIESCRGPVAIRYPRGVAEGVALPSDPAPLEIGRAEVVRDGADVTVFALGRMCAVARQAAEILSAEAKLEVAVVNMRFVKPLDRDLLAERGAAGRPMFSLEDNTVVGGLGSAIAEALADMNYSGPPCAPLGLPDRFIEHGELCDLFGTLELTPDGVARAIRKRLGR
jgi:1-deoxy-D-xylulose-5-phosphate synthase